MSQTLDTTASAQHHLYKSLLKLKAVADHPALPDEVKDSQSAATDPATLNVNARLCKSNQVQDVLSTALADIQQSLGLHVEEGTKGKKRRVRKKDLSPDTEPSVSDTKAAKAQRRAKEPLQSSEEPDNHILEQSSHGAERSFLEGHEAQPVGSAQDEKGQSEHYGREATPEGLKDRVSTANRNGYSLEADLSMSDLDSRASSRSPEPQKKTATKKASFLPSLTMAGYISGSGSDVGDDIDVAPKKNRRGQRARQQIWEQKFGDKAKHIQKQDRDAGWNPKRGAVESDGLHHSKRIQRGRRASPDYALGGDGRGAKPRITNDASKKKHSTNEGPIHPSWEAAKKAKEKRAAPVAFQGKKISFD